MWDDCSDFFLSKLNSLHCREAKLPLADKNPPTNEKLKALSIFPLLKQLHFHKTVLMFKSNRKMTPSYITSGEATTDPIDIYYLDPATTFTRPISHSQVLPVGIHCQQSSEPLNFYSRTEKTGKYENNSQAGSASSDDTNYGLELSLPAATALTAV